MKGSPQADSPTLELWKSGSVRVCLSFHWCDDRYEHRLEVIDGRRRCVCLASCEGADHEFWPPSPALQQLTLQQVGQGRSCILLVGMAGKSHWSLSVEREDSAVVFDAACRLQQPPAWLGSQYRVLPSLGCPQNGRLRIPCEHDSLEISLEPVQDQGILTRDADRGTLAIAPWTKITDMPSTVRWRYRMRLFHPAGQLLQASEHDHSA